MDSTSTRGASVRRNGVRIREVSRSATHHARRRMTSRRISTEAVDAALEFGRTFHVRGALIRALGRRDVAKAMDVHGRDLREFEGVQGVCSSDGETIITVYKNSDFRRLRPRW